MKRMILMVLGALAAQIAFAQTETEIVDGITWKYFVSKGVTFVGSDYWLATSAVPTNTTGTITIPSVLGGNPVTGIGPYAFLRCDKLTSVKIPDNVTIIGNYAFDGCSSITNMTIPNNVASIAFNAFRGCSGLTSVTIPDSVTIIWAYAFIGCSKLTSVTLPNGVTKIHEYAFNACSNLTNVVIQGCVTNIGSSAFAECADTVHILLPTEISMLTIDGNASDAGTKIVAEIKNKDGYVFSGWKNTAGEVVADPFHSPSTVTVYPWWKKVVKFAYNANGGTGTMEAQTVLEGDDLTLADNSFARTGYAFLGWSVSADGDVAYEDGATIHAASAEMDGTVLYAAWKPNVPEIDPVDDTTFTYVSQKVSLSHESVDAMILYTTDGSGPKENGHEWKDSFTVYKSCRVRAVAYGAGRYSEEVSIMLTREDSLGEAANFYGYTMETDSAAPWTVDAAVSHDGVSSVRSGAIGNNGTTYLMASVKKAGTVSFWWKAQCEEPDEEDGEDGYYDYGAFLVDDVVKARIAGNDTGWRFVSVEVPTGGKHILRWEYRKDNATLYAPDCVWVDQVQWSPADGSGYTLTSPEPVPYSWLSQYGLGVASGDFEAAANAANGKTIWGRPMSVWQDYVAGTVPTNLESTLKTRIEMQGATPLVTWDPNLNEDGVARRLYKIYGSETLENGGEWQYPTNSLHRFFKVTVEMP